MPTGHPTPLLGKRVFALNVIGRAAIGGKLALVCASSFEAFELARTAGVAPLSLPSAILHRPCPLVVDVGFVAVRHIVHIVAMAARVVAVDVVRGTGNTVL